MSTVADRKSGVALRLRQIASRLIDDGETLAQDFVGSDGKTACALCVVNADRLVALARTHERQCELEEAAR